MDGDIAVAAEWFTDDDGVVSGTTCGPIEYEDRVVEGIRFPDLAPAAQRKFYHLPIPVIEGSLPTVEAEARLFSLLNFGGVAMSDEDRRRAEAVAAGEAS